jgi:hypothetical protein
MIPARSVPTTDIGVFRQNGGYVFVGVEQDAGWSGDVLFSGKRSTLGEAMKAARALAGDDHDVMYTNLDSMVTDW